VADLTWDELEAKVGGGAAPGGQAAAVPVARPSQADTWAALEQRLGGQRQAFGQARAEKPPTLLDEDREAAIQAVAQNKIDDKQLLANTMAALQSRYPVIAPGEDDSGALMGITAADKDGSITVMVPDALAEIYRGAHKILRAQAEQQPEIGSFAARAGAGLKASPNGAINYLQNRFPDAQIIPDVDEDGTLTGNAIIREPGKPPRYLDRKDLWTLGDVADLSGDALETSVGTAGAVGGALLGGPAGAVAGGAVGGGLGAAARQVASATLPGADNLSTGDRLVNIGLSAGLGAAGEAAAIPIAVGARVVGRTMLQGARRVYGVLPEAVPGVAAARRSAATTELAKTVGIDVGGQASQGLKATTTKKFYERTQEIEQTLSALNVDDPVKFTVPEATGSKYGLGVQRVLAQTPETMDEMAMMKARKAASISKAADRIVDLVAANPDELGDATVGEATAGTVSKYIGAAREARSATAGPIYRASSEAGGGARNTITDSTRKALGDIIESNKFNPAKTESQARAVLDKLTQAGTKKGGRVTIDDMQNLRSLFVGIQSGELTPIEGLAVANQRRLAGKVLDAIETDLTATEGTVNGEAATLLRKANSTWREMSKPINEAATDVLNRILKLDQAGAGESVVGRVMSMSGKQRRGLFDILEKTDPAVAKNLRAQVLLGVYESGGKMRAATEFGRDVLNESTTTGMRPVTLANSLRKNADLLGELFGQDLRTRKNLLALVGGLDRLGSGPGIEGSDTMFKSLVQLTSRFGGGGGDLVSQAARAAAKAIDRRLMSPQAMMEALSTPEGIASVETMIRPLISKTPPTVDMLRESISAMGRLAGEATLVDPEQKPRMRQ